MYIVSWMLSFFFEGTFLMFAVNIMLVGLAHLIIMKNVTYVLHTKTAKWTQEL